MNVYEKLQQCRVELQSLGLKKGGKNKFANFEYYELNDFLPSVNSLFNKHKLFSCFNIDKEVAILDIIDSEKPEEKITFSSHIADGDIKGCLPIQSLGGVHTYMKRYLYMNALEIVEHDGIDGNNNEPVSLVTEEQLQFINGLDDKLKQFALKKYNIQSLDQLTEEQAAHIINSLKEKGNK